MSTFLANEVLTQIFNLKSQLITNLSQTNINSLWQDHPEVTAKLQNQHQSKSKLPKELHQTLHHPIITLPLQNSSATAAIKAF